MKNLEEYKKMNKFWWLGWVGIFFYLLGIILFPLIPFFIVHYNSRFVGPIPTISFVLVPMVLGNWCFAFGSVGPTFPHNFFSNFVYRHRFLGNFIITLLFIYVLIIFSNLPDYNP